MGAIPVEDQFLEDLVTELRFIQVRLCCFLIHRFEVGLCFYSMANYNHCFLTWRTGKA